MSAQTQTVLKAAGLVLLVVGVGLVFWGYQMSGAVTAQLTRAITGAAPDGVMYRYIGGAAGIVAGVFLLFKR
ncbi:DUF3185 family protein [Trichlorobacter sp.]|uniref:DUF3185 family protein n=1 Tax=Trichlorobacter sp. TaxID=2911007 RepID=UPI002A36F400|nr:DUF3185 family protein [Trichlorobacter sp.]MDY0383368.1 DUF3185 family protein [Trichlorobacter sp.]